MCVCECVREESGEITTEINQAGKRTAIYRLGFAYGREETLLLKKKKGLVLQIVITVHIFLNKNKRPFKLRQILEIINSLPSNLLFYILSKHVNLKYLRTGMYSIIYN